MSIGASGELTLAAGSQVTGNGSLVVEGAAHVGDGAALGVATTINGHATFEGAATMSADLNISGKALVAGSLETTGAIRVDKGGELELAGSGMTSCNYNLSGEGQVTFNTGGDVTYYSGSLKVGTLNVASGSLDASVALDLGTVELGAGTTFTVRNTSAAAGANKAIGDVYLGAGSVLKQFSSGSIPTRATRVESMTLQGSSGSLEMTNLGGWWQVGSLKMAEGVENATLDLTTTHTAYNFAVFDLGNNPADGDAGNFQGVIRLNQEGTGINRHTALILSHNEVAKGAVISVTMPNSLSTAVVVGLDADDVQIKGLESSSSMANQVTLFSGTLTANTTGNGVAVFQSSWIQEAKARTLHIDTDAGESYSYYGNILENVSIAKEGAGTQKFLGAVSEVFNGTIAINEGVLAFNDASKGMLGTAFMVTVGTEDTVGTLDLSAIAFDSSAENAIAMKSGSGVIFSQNAELVLQSGLGEGTYQIFDTSAGGSLVGWESDNISVFSDGYKLSSSSWTFGSDGSLTIVQGEERDLVWAGGSFGAWTVLNDTNWDASGSNTGFDSNDSVTFDSSATVALGENIKAGGITVNEGVTLTLTNDQGCKMAAKSVTLNGNLVSHVGIDVAEDVVSGEAGGRWELASGARQSLTKAQLDCVTSMVVDEGATLALSDTQSGDVAVHNVTGIGVLEVALTADSKYGNFLLVGSGFTGETYVTAGNMTVDSSHAHMGSVLHLGANVNIGWSLGDSRTSNTFGSNLVLDGTSQMHTNGSRTIILTGEVSGSGTWDHRGSGTFRFQNTVDLGGFTQTSNVTTIFEGGSAHIGTLEHSSGSVRVQSGTELSVDVLKESATNGLALEQGATLSVGGMSITGTAAGSNVKGDATDYAADNTAYTITKAEAVYTGEGDVTLANKLVDVSVRNASRNGGTMNVDLSQEGTNVVSVVAESGNINLINSPDQLLELERLATVDTGLVISASASSLSREAGAVELSVSQEVNLAAGTTLEASLSVGQGAMLDLGGAVSMSGNSLTLGNGLVLGDKLETALENLVPMGSLTLFTDVGELYVADEATMASLLDGSPVLASSVLTSPVLGEAYVLAYSGQPGSGVLSIQLVPEPTTATLSLLALAGLAARRRRK